MSNTDEKYIYKVSTSVGNYYRIKKSLKGKLKYFGSFPNMDEARDKKAELIENDWVTDWKPIKKTANKSRKAKNRIKDYMLGKRSKDNRMSLKDLICPACDFHKDDLKCHFTDPPTSLSFSFVKDELGCPQKRSYYEGTMRYL